LCTNSRSTLSAAAAAAPNEAAMPISATSAVPARRVNRVCNMSSMTFSSMCKQLFFWFINMSIACLGKKPSRFWRSGILAHERGAALSHFKEEQRDPVCTCLNRLLAGVTRRLRGFDLREDLTQVVRLGSLQWRELHVRLQVLQPKQ